MLKKILTLCTLAVGLFLPALACAQQSNISFEVLATFRDPNAVGHDIYDFGIANNGASAGYVLHTEYHHQYAQGFILSRSGKFSEPIIYPNASDTYLYGVNVSGVACGVADFSSQGATSFFYDGQSFTEYQVPGSLFTFVYCINDKGDFGGRYLDPTTFQDHAFVNIGGVLTSFDVPGGAFAEVNGINNSGQAVGSYSYPNDDSLHGFFRDRNGALTYPLDYAGAKDTLLNGINDSGIIVGYWIDELIDMEAFVLQLPSQFTAFQVSSGSNTEFQGINNSGLVSGQYNPSQPYRTKGVIVKLSR